MRTGVLATLLLLSAVASPAFAAQGPDPLCELQLIQETPPALADALSAQISKPKFSLRAGVNRVLQYVPILYFDPLPKIRMRLNDAKIATARLEYEIALKAAADGETIAPLKTPRTNDEKIALIEAVAATVKDRAESDPLFKAARESEEKDLIRYLSRWKARKGKPITPKDVYRLMDVVYLAANASYFKFFGIKHLIRGERTVEALVRSRWQNEILRNGILQGMQNLNMAGTKNSIVRSTLNFLGGAFGHGLGVLANATAFQMFGIPAFFPKVEFLKLPTVEARMRKIAERVEEIGEEKAFEEFRSKFKGLTRVDFYYKRAKKIYPLISTTVFFWALYQLYQALNQGMDDGLEDIEKTQKLVTREELESFMLKELENAYEEVHQGEPVSDETRDHLRSVVSHMKLKELDAVSKEVQSGKHDSLKSLLNQ